MSQRQRVLSVMKCGHWMTLFEIQARIIERFGVTDSQTAISARLRDYSNERDGYIKLARPRTKGSGTWIYRFKKV